MTSTKIHVMTEKSNATVYQASYRPLPWLSSPACRHQPLSPDDYSKRPRVTFDSVTEHQDTYRPMNDAPDPIKSTRPRDRCGLVLAGDGVCRAHNTSYKTDYSVKSGQSARLNNSKIHIQRPLHISIQSETTTDADYGPIAIPKLWRRPRSVYVGSSSPMETVTVHRSSYRPLKSNSKVETRIKTKCACITTEQRCVTDDIRKSTVPMENCTTYTTTYDVPGYEICKNLDTIQQDLQFQQQRTAVEDAALCKAYNYIE